MRGLMLSCVLTLTLALTLQLLAGCGSSYQSQSALRMKELCAARQSSFQGEAQPVDPSDVSVPFDFGDVSGTTVREITVGFDNGGALSWPVWNNPRAVSQTPLDLSATGACGVQVPAAQ